VPSGCIDVDGDGFYPVSETCTQGTDCDDSNRLKGDREICADGEDNDCDTQVDEPISPACGCDPACYSGGAGDGTGNDFTAPTDPNAQVGVDDNGFLILTNKVIKLDPYIWIANTGDGSVSKFSTDPAQLNANGTFREVGRYWTDKYMNAVGGQNAANSNDPSRTSVSVDGIVYIANRTRGSVTAIAANAVDCRSGLKTVKDGTLKNGTVGTPNGMIEYAEMIDWGATGSQDACVLWNKDLTSSTVVPSRGCWGSTANMCIRAIAAQPVHDQADGGLSTYVWVGDSAGNIWKLDGRTGAVLLTTTSPVGSYGFAIDRRGQLWISCHFFCQSNTVQTPYGFLGRIDTNRCTTPETCSQPVCAGEGPPHDTCVKQRIDIPNVAKAYGITVDKEQNVWIGSAHSGTDVKYGLYRYTPSAPYKAVAAMTSTQTVGRWSYFEPTDDDSVPPIPTSIAGVTADDLGFVYGGGMNSFVHIWARASFPAATSYLKFTAAHKVPHVNQTSGPYGMAVDTQDRVWAIHRGYNDVNATDDFASVIEHTVKPGKKPPYQLSDVDFRLATPNAKNPTGAPDAKWSAINLNWPYTYSDMTGVQARLATGKRGSYLETFEGCSAGKGDTQWNQLVFRATIPQGSVLHWAIRTGDTLEELRSPMNPFISLGEMTAQSPRTIDLSKVLSETARRKHLIEVRVDLIVNTEGNITPIIEYFETTFSCTNEVS